MSNKKGFILIETIVTIVVLAVSLLYVYSNFNSILIKEKTRVHYDDVAHMYHTFYIKDYFSDYNLNQVLKNLNDENPMIIIGCDYVGIFDADEESNKTVCDALVNSLGITRITVSLGNLSYIQDDCDNEESNRCSYLQNFSDEELVYLETLGDLSKDNRYIMIIEYSETKILGEDSVSTKNKIHNSYNYAWVKI